MKTGQRKFGSSDGTLTKLETVYNYANFYTNVLKDKPISRLEKFRLTYVDAFAGAGKFPYAEELPFLEDAEDFETVVEGSALRSLKVDHPFDRYVFSDIKRSNVNELSLLKDEFPELANRIQVARQDANDLVAEFCSKMTERDRALMFLDPFGNHVNFETLRLIADTKKIDLFYLFPSWWGVARQVSKTGKIVEESEASLSRVFGTNDWGDQLVKEVPEPDLFDEDATRLEKIATVDSVTRFMIERMRTIFGDGVSDRWLPLGSNGRPGYSLIFACANDAERARKLAKRVARSIMKRK